MPIYEYRCQACGGELEKLQRMSDAPLTDCPACGRPELKRLISAAAFRLKGGGWYETDFKKDGKRNLADSGDGEKKPTSKSDGDKATSGAGTGSSDSGSKSETQSTSTPSKPAAGGASA